jgi:FkbM family methyltransferase
MVTDKLYRALGSWPLVQAQAKRIVRKLPHRMRTVERFGQRFTVDPSELCGFYLYYEDEYDNFVFDFLKGVIGKYSSAIDIGANIGIYTCFFAARIGYVHAFEPDPFICTWLRRNLALNNLSNVSVHEACVGRSNGIVRFLPGHKKNRGMGRMARMEATGIDRDCICMDKFIEKGFPVPCLIKMDIEGAEWLALQGARRLLSLGVRHLTSYSKFIRKRSDSSAAV